MMGTVDDVMEPWHIEDNHNSIRDAAAWSIDYRAMGSVWKQW